MLADSGIELVDVRSVLDHSLKVLQTFEKASLMSRKACNCISGFLRLFDTLGSEQPMAAALDATQEGEPAADVLVDSSWTMAENMSMVPENLFSQYVAQSADEFLFQYSDTTFLDGDMDIGWD
ncbi:hypothetical protein LARI1_G003983 [Lachnellula arida]|uniref:Uncharacterized protein n=1 Tax=Lachnellula arida TaxID=1316785 RepID=A0A8T9BD10_9HELO|nr:hypothetical protein LARI1_G003983 [Lachnellula arida]